MTNEELLITVVRLLGALFVLKWAIVGSIIAIAVDFSDLFVMNLVDLGGVRNYQALDKWLDLSYMVTFLYVAMKWNSRLARLSLGLFTFRICGLLLFEITGNRWVLLAFPNFFEFYFVIAAIVWKKERLQFNSKLIKGFMLMLFLLKMLQEFVLHGGRWLDNYRATEVVINLWQITTKSLMP